MIRMENVQYTNVKEPFWGLPSMQPILPDEVYQRRLANALGIMKTNALDFMLIYADREHYGNFDYLVGYGPRFEEGLLVLDASGTVHAVLGNECANLYKYSRIPSKGILCQAFSLPNQPMDKHKDIGQILTEIGIGKSHTIGIVGWKLMYPIYGSRKIFDAPSFIVESVKELVGEENILNATDFFIHPEYGIRCINDAHEIAYFEFGGTCASDSVQQILLNFRTGMNEVEISRLGTEGGLATSAFPKVLAGKRMDMGMVSPTTNELHLGDRFQASIPLIGGLTCRRGFAAYSEADLPEKARDYLDVIAKPYFATVANWYEKIGIGVSGGDIYDMVETTYPKAKYGWFLNPGHLIGTEEWMASPIYPGSSTTLKSGMCLQMDIIPSTEPHYAAPNAEDGVALADESLRRDLKQKYPEVHDRIEKRRDFMINTLNINIRPEVLPLSNLAGLYRPFMLNRDKAFVIGK